MSNSGRRRLGMALLCLFAMLTPLAAAQSFTPDEVIVGLTFNIAKYVEWPKAPEASEDQEVFRIGVVGNEDLQAAFAVLQNKQLKGRTTEVSEIDNKTSIKDLRRCKILYVSSTASLEYYSLNLGQGQLLVTSNRKGAARRGMAALEFVQEKNKIAFDFNQDELRRAKIKVQASLLNLAREVHPKK